MQFKVPQFIEIEDKIIGPLTLKQFFYLAGGGVLIVFMWYFMKFLVFLFLSVPVAALAISLAFVKINGQPFGRFLLSVIGFAIEPRIYTWKNKHE